MSVFNIGFDSYENEKSEFETSIVTVGGANKTEGHLVMSFSSSNNKIEEGDSVTILPLEEKINKFDISIEGVENEHLCGEKSGKYYTAEKMKIETEKIPEIKEKESSFWFLVLKPKAKNATLLDSIGRELPDGFKESTVEAAVDTDSDGRADLLKFGLCCYRRAHPDSTSCRECTMAYRIQGDSLKRTYSSASC